MTGIYIKSAFFCGRKESFLMHTFYDKVGNFLNLFLTFDGNGLRLKGLRLLSFQRHDCHLSALVCSRAASLRSLVYIFLRSEGYLARIMAFSLFLFECCCILDRGLSLGIVDNSLTSLVLFDIKNVVLDYSL